MESSTILLADDRLWLKKSEPVSSANRGSPTNPIFVNELSLLQLW